MEYLDTAEAEYRTLYRKGKFSNKDSTPDSAFVGGSGAGGGGDRREKNVVAIVARLVT